MNLRRQPHFTELVADFDVVTRPNTQALVDTLTSIIVPGTSAKLLVEVIGAKAMPDAAQTFCAWINTQQKLLRGAQLAYVVTGRTLTAEAKLLQGVSAEREVQLRVFRRRAQAIDWLVARPLQPPKRVRNRSYSWPDDATVAASVQFAGVVYA